MSQQAHVSSEALHRLMDGLQSCASSVASLRGAVRAHINECLNTAKTIVARLKAIEDAAKARYEHCYSAYYSCQRMQKYDDESGEYRPSCSCEERDMKNAGDELYKARCAREQAEMRLQDMEREVGYYEQATGGEGMMNSITDDYVPQATNRLMALNDKVQRYEALEIAGIDIGDNSSSTPTLQAPQSKALGFGKGTERLKEKMRQREALFGAYCPKCKCCPCECDIIRELVMSRSR
ncbi:MAG: hypothetical protein K2M06_09255 [Muribaculaceae bacterium]|nr:hypothetical protein [Muribaculaceae bacterium]